MPASVRIGLMVNHCFSFYRSILQGVRAYAEVHPEWQFMAVREKQGHVKWRGGERPHGLIASVNTTRIARAVRSWRAPLVNVSALLPDLPWPRVAVDNNDVGRLAAEHLLERGVQNFAFVGPTDHLYSVEREAAFRAALRAVGADVASFHPRRIRPFEPLRWFGYLDRRVETWLLKLPRPVGILTAADSWGVSLTEECHQLGLRVPEDVAIVGVDNDDLYTEFSRPRLSSVALPTRQIGYEAAAMLDRLLAGQRLEASRRTLLLPPTHVHVRRSSDVLAIDDQLVVAAARFIRERAHLPLTVTDVLREVPASRRSLERRFREHLGRGVAAEIRRVHLERSQRLLAETELSVAEVALQSGFSGARQMIAAFRRERGVLPSDYRRQYRRDVEDPR